jgi:hypothetical protein
LKLSGNAFEAICDEAAKVAEKLTTRLDKLKLKDGKLRKWHSLQHAVDTAWSRINFSITRNNSQDSKML